MLSAVLFEPDESAARMIEHAARELKDVCIYKTMYAFPSAYELTRIVNCFDPDVVFVGFSDMEEARVLARSMQLVSPKTAVIGIARIPDSKAVEQAMSSGVHEVVCLPVALENLRTALSEALAKARPVTHENLLTFLPAKAGAGSTTIAVNVAGALANDLDQKVLVIEADLRSGLISLLLKCSSEYSVLHALENATALDGTLWSKIVVKAHGLDLLVGPRATGSTVVSWTNYHHLLDFVRTRYDSIVVDLPEVVNDATVEIVRRARKVFIVTTAELPSLVLARQRRQELTKNSVSKDCISFILNRWTKGDLEVEQIAEFLDGPVTVTIQNDYQCVRRAIQEGRLVGRKSELGKALSALAAQVSSWPGSPVIQPGSGPAAHAAKTHSLLK